MDYKTLKPSINTGFEGFFQWLHINTTASVTTESVFYDTFTLPVSISALYGSGATNENGTSFNQSAIRISENTISIACYNPTTAPSTHKTGFNIKSTADLRARIIIIGI